MAKARNVYWQDLRPGMCVLIPEQEDELDDKVVDCRSEHHAEVIHRGKLAGNRTWPGDDTVDTAALARCEQAFAEYVGLPYDSSRLDIDFYTTDQEGWKAGDRTLVCLLFDPEQEFATQSFKGSRQ